MWLQTRAGLLSGQTFRRLGLHNRVALFSKFGFQKVRSFIAPFAFCSFCCLLDACTVAAAMNEWSVLCPAASENFGVCIASYGYMLLCSVVKAFPVDCSAYVWSHVIL